VKRAFILLPLMLPKLSDTAAAHLLDILEQLLASVRHHYQPQIHRWQRRQCHADLRLRAPPATLFGDEPF
jgi:hypothetical protein